jgi:hypothetical protein
MPARHGGSGEQFEADVPERRSLSCGLPIVAQAILSYLPVEWLEYPSNIGRTAGGHGRGTIRADACTNKLMYVDSPPYDKSGIG